jgi:hypothetical protein
MPEFLLVLLFWVVIAVIVTTIGHYWLRRNK